MRTSQEYLEFLYEGGILADKITSMKDVKLKNNARMSIAAYLLHNVPKDLREEFFDSYEQMHKEIEEQFKRRKKNG